jgi:hypothetical protein
MFQLNSETRNKDALGGSFRRDIIVDARAIEDVIEDDVDNWREWPPVCTDGEMTAFIELVSEGRVCVLLQNFCSNYPTWRDRLNFILTSLRLLLIDRSWTGTAKKLVSIASANLLPPQSHPSCR